MKIIEDGKRMEYHQLDNGTCYSVLTPVRVVEILEKYRNGKTRIRVFYGDQETGRCWMEEYDTMGTIGRSTGRIKIPLLIKTKRSFGGVAILDSAIVKITVKIPGVVTPQIVYQHPKFWQSELFLSSLKNTGTPELPWTVCQKVEPTGGMEVYAHFATKVKAERYIAFMRGERNSK